MTQKTRPQDRRLAETLHELRSPLGGIEAMADMLRESGLDEGQRRIVAALIESCRHLRAIATEMLEPGRTQPESGAMLPAFVATFAIGADARARRAGLDFAVSGADALPDEPVRDPVALRQVLENLIDNAVRLTPGGRITLEIARAEPARLRFALSDSGPGLSADEAERLIAEGGGIAGRPGGAGLGLSIAGGLVAARGGRLRGGPAPGGKGACFAFDWPREPIAEMGAAAADPARAGPACLIVDDHPAARKVLATILEAAGHACLQACGAREALAMLESAPVCTVLTDLNMPEPGGRSLIARLHALPADSRPRIVVVSGEAIAADDPLLAEVDAVILKPITVQAVLAAAARPEKGAARHAA